MPLPAIREEKRVSSRLTWAVLAVVAALGWTHGCGSDKAPTAPSNASVRQVTLTAAKTSFGMDQTVQFDAMAQRQDGTSASCAAGATWQSSNAAVVTISGSGLARGVSEGEADIRAICAGVTGTTHVRITSVHGSYVSVTPYETTLTPGQTLQLTANLCFTDGTCEECQATSTWENLSPAAVTIDAHGLVTSLAVAEYATVGAHCAQQLGYASIHVKLPDASFGHRVEFNGAVCGSPSAPGIVLERCIYGGDSTEAHHFIDVTRAGSMQIYVHAIGGHDYGDSLDLDVRCDNRIVKQWTVVEVDSVAFAVEPCRYEIKAIDPEPFGERYQLIIQYP
jgi:hypothetical protein